MNRIEFLVSPDEQDSIFEIVRNALGSANYVMGTKQYEDSNDKFAIILDYDGQAATFYALKENVLITVIEDEDDSKHRH